MADATRTLDDIARDYRAVQGRQDRAVQERLRNEEACHVLLGLLRALVADESSFIHRVAVKGGILIRGELRSPRASADIDLTAGRMRSIDPTAVVADVSRVGQPWSLRPNGFEERSGNTTVSFTFASRTNSGPVKVEISAREDPVFELRHALFNLGDLGIEPFSVSALSEVELVAEKLRALSQRAQPRDLFDLHLYLVDAGWHLDPGSLRHAADVKFAQTRHRRWKWESWQLHLAEIEERWEGVLLAWVEPQRIPPFSTTLDDVRERLRQLRMA